MSYIQYYRKSTLIGDGERALGVIMRCLPPAELSAINSFLSQFNLPLLADNRVEGASRLLRTVQFITPQPTDGLKSGIVIQCNIVVDLDRSVILLQSTD